VETIDAGLRAFRGDPGDNPGRGNLFSLGEVLVYADFAHNPDSVRALANLAEALAPRRRLIVLGQAGDRNDASLRALCHAAWRARPDRILVKPLHHHLRGRPEGEVVDRLVTFLREAGAAADAIRVCDSELHAVHEALAWARPGDLLLLLLHEARAEALASLARLQASGWRPLPEAGDQLPADG
jgi:UDP-N-acetylmuramyl tripeptide synthase